MEDIDRLSARDALLFIDMFKNDLEFRRFVALKVKEKIMQTPNLPMRELMNVLTEVLDLEDLRGEIIRYALNSEVFYAFPFAYLISILKKVSLVKYAEDIKDLIKTI